MAAFSPGRTADQECELDELIKGWGDQWPSEIAAACIWAGDYDNASEWLELSARTDDSTFSSNQFDPMLAGIQKDPR
jgi:hypothetical protein